MKFATIGAFVAKPEKGQALLTVLELAATFMQTYPGCEEYRVFRDGTDAQKIWVFETWVSEEAHTQCLQDPQVQEAAIKAAPLILDMSQRFSLIPTL